GEPLSMLIRPVAISPALSDSHSVLFQFGVHLAPERLDLLIYAMRAVMDCARLAGPPARLPSSSRGSQQTTTRSVAPSQEAVPCRGPTEPTIQRKTLGSPCSASIPAPVTDATNRARSRLAATASPRPATHGISPPGKASTAARMPPGIGRQQGCSGFSPSCACCRTEPGSRVSKLRLGGRPLDPGPGASRQDDDRVNAGDDVIQHDAPAATQAPVNPANRPGLPDVEQAEQGKARQHPEQPGGCKTHGEPVADELVPDDAGVVLDAQSLRGQTANGNARDKGEAHHEQQVQYREGLHAPEQKHGNQGSGGTGSAGR